MAGRGWSRSVGTAAVSSAAIAAAQIGVGYGLGIINWVPPASAQSEGAWPAALIWTVWIAATSVVFGALVGDRTADQLRGGAVVRGMWRLVIALAAGIGTLLAVPLFAVPARAVHLTHSFAPHLLASVYAIAGVILGLVLALFALTIRAVAANIITTSIVTWILAAVAVGQTIATGHGPALAHLGIWKFTTQGPMWHAYYIPGVLIMLCSALVIGGLAAFPGAGRGDSRVGVAISGAAGPLVVAVAYTLVAPSSPTAPFEQLSALATAPYMVVAGLAGSVLVAAIGGGGHPQPVSPAPATALAGAQPPLVAHQNQTVIEGAALRENGLRSRE